MRPKTIFVPKYQLVDKNQTQSESDKTFVEKNVVKNIDGGSTKRGIDYNKRRGDLRKSILEDKQSTWNKSSKCRSCKRIIRKKNHFSYYLNNTKIYCAGRWFNVTKSGKM